ncbi:MAG: hypothetical protein WCK29_01065 [archaeon]
MKEIIKTALQTAGLVLGIGTSAVLGTYDAVRGHDPVREFKASGRLESGQKYLIADTTFHQDLVNPLRHIYLAGLGNVRTSHYANAWAQTYDVTGNDGKLVLINDDYILATNKAPWFAKNAVSNPELRKNMIDLANKVLAKEHIDTKIREGSPNTMAALDREKNTQ